MALRAVDEDRDGKQVVADRTLAVGKDGLRRYRKLIPAWAAFPELARRDRRNPRVTAFRAVRLAAVVRPPDFAELGVRFLVRHTRNGR